MPPRKRTRTRRSHAASPHFTSPLQTPTPAAHTPSKADEHIPPDPWTDEEEIGLFKGLLKWKPTGVHKHFRLLQLHQYLLDDKYIHPRNDHTRPAGIWRKLQSMYDLDALDEREDARQLSDLSLHNDDDDEEEEEGDGNDDDVYSEAANKIHKEDFDLPEEEFGERKWKQRFASEKQRKGESPPALPELNLAGEPPVRFTPSFSVEPSEAATPFTRGGRVRSGPASRVKGRGGMVQAQAQVPPAASTRRAMRQVESVEQGEEKKEEEDDDDAEEAEEGNGDEGEEKDESGEEEDEPSEAASTPARSTRAARSVRGRGTTRTTIARARGRTRQRRR